MKLTDLLLINSGLVGIAFFLMGIGTIRVCKDPAANEQWVEKKGLYFIIGGLALFVTGLYKAVLLF